MADKLNISLVQYDIAWESAGENLSKIENLLAENDFNADLIVLPEMFQTGFSMKPSRIATSMNGEIPEWMKTLAAAKNAVILGSLAIIENGCFYNRLLAVTGDGVIAQYDKRHLFRMAGENKVYTAGNKNVVFKIGRWRLAMFICYDIRFPVWSRNLNDYDLAVYVANWPEKRSAIWNTLLKARAIENQCFVAGVNRIGNDGAENYNGESMIVDFNGDVMNSAFDNECVINCTMDLNLLNDFRVKFPAWKDADNFQINV